MPCVYSGMDQQNLSWVLVKPLDLSKIAITGVFLVLLWALLWPSWCKGQAEFHEPVCQIDLAVFKTMSAYLSGGLVFYVDDLFFSK